jgi:hypothetical protein
MPTILRTACLFDDAWKRKDEEWSSIGVENWRVSRSAIARSKMAAS